MRINAYFDLEATGLSRWHDKITQIGVTATLDTGTECIILGEFETLVKTDRIIHPEASKLTGITNEMLKDAPTTQKSLHDLIYWLKELRTKTECKNENPNITLIAYNGINYDFPMLFSEFERWGMSAYVRLSSCGIDYLLDPLLWATKHIDTTCLLRKASGKCSFKLGDVHNAIIGNEIQNAHQALADTQGLMNICQHQTFCTMELKESKYCLSLKEYVGQYTIKRKSIDKAIKNNTKNKIYSLIDMQKAARKRKEKVLLPIIHEKKLKTQELKNCVHNSIVESKHTQNK